tara:strand:- start:603 stop:806 length:204 start_codon:yes stop_codon:yes gene_type:complete
MNNEITELSLSEHLKVKFNEIRKDYINHLGSGACRDFSEYQKMVGIIEGINLAERELADYIDRFLEK